MRNREERALSWALSTQADVRVLEGPSVHAIALMPYTVYQYVLMVGHFDPLKSHHFSGGEELEVG